MKREKSIILAARIVSLVFTPFYLPLLGLMALFAFSYLALLPWAYKLQVLTLVYVFTILLPTVLIHLYRRYQGWSLIELGHKERRMVPYVISILCYFFCIYLMDLVHIPHFMSGILSAALFIQVACALINVWWKISTHTAAVGGVVGALFVSASCSTSIPCGGSVWCSSSRECWAPAASSSVSTRWPRLWRASSWASCVLSWDWRTCD